MIHVSCECGYRNDVGESQAGAQVRCPDCDALVDVPVPEKPDRSSRECPECGSRSTRRITTRRELRRKVPGGDPLAGTSEELNQAFAFRLPRECLSCQAVWMPSIPRFAGVLL